MTSTSDSGQVEPGPFSEDDLRKQWNAQADEFNQWESLDLYEQLAWAQTRAIATITHTIPVAWCRSDDFRGAAQKRQSFSGWREQHSDCDMALYEHPQAGATAPDADQAEGPSLAGVDELCAEFSFHYEDGDSLEILQEMITAAITRWRASVAQPAAQPVDLATPAPEDPGAERVLRLAAIIREVDPARLPRAWAHRFAQALLAHPGFSGCLDGPVALPAQEEVRELVEFVDELASARILTATYAAQLRRCAAILKGIPALPAQGFRIGPQEYIPHA